MVELKLRKSFHENGTQFAWDSTSIKAFQKCPRYYQYTVLEGWRRSGDNPHLKFGGLYASALEHYYKHIANGMSVDEATDEVVLEAMIATWDYPPLSGGADGQIPIPTDPPHGKPWVSTDSVKNRENLIRTIIWYLAEFGDNDKLKVITQINGIPAVEYSFSLPVDDGIIFCGHIDRLAEMEDMIYVMDQKTTGATITPKWWKQFKPNTQMSMYSFAGKAIYHMPIQGVIIDAVQVAVGFSRFERSITPRTDAELNEFYDETMTWIMAAQRATLENNFPMNPESCDKYGGCEFRDVCQRSPSVRSNFLKASFHQNDPWDPLERR